jgi:hypothetical protein
MKNRNEDRAYKTEIQVFLVLFWYLFVNKKSKNDTMNTAN